MIRILNEEVKATDLQDKVAAGTTTVQTARVDMAGFDGVLFLVKIGTIVATGTVDIKAHQAATDINGQELVGSKETLADTDDDTLVLIDVRDPDDRFVQIQIDRGVANSEVDGVFALQYRANAKPTTHDAAVKSKSVVRAAEV